MKKGRLTTRSASLLAYGMILLASSAVPVMSAVPEEAYVRVSPRDARYFELSDGRPYVPIGLNMIAPDGRRGIDGMDEWMGKLADNGGSFIRVWLGNPFFDVEHEKSGVYDKEKAKRIDEMLALCRKHGIRVKMCIESFRHFGTQRQSWSEKKLHLIENGGPAKDIADFFDGERSREQFKRKLAWYRDRYGDRPEIFGWELWNEVNAVAGGDYMAWTEIMLGELQRLFPKNLCMQSLGSYDRESKRVNYRRLSLMPDNDVAQVHRYLDLGAQIEACRGPVDVLAADAVRDILSFKAGKPTLLAESGAVEPNHSGPFKLYKKDKAGIILHDVLFAPFFVGAAGPGHIWHWGQYVDANNLWWQFGRFAEAIRGIDPAAEKFEPSMIEHPRLRVYVLNGRRTVLVWCRDKNNTWMSELRDGKDPETVESASLEFNGEILPAKQLACRIYDPWANRWADAVVKERRISLPSFSRSIVVRIDRD